jgi:hypothetical protein
MRTQHAIYWKNKGIDMYGRPTFEDPIVIKCRWDAHSPQNDVQDTQDSASNPTTVFPDRILVVGSYLMFGDQTVLDGIEGTPPNLQSAFMIKSVKVVPRWKYRHLPMTPDTQSDQIMIEVTL